MSWKTGDSGNHEPIDLPKLASQLGLLTVWAPLGQGIDGLCAADREHGLAVVNSDHWGSRQRFTLAHEIAHWLLGDVGPDGRSDRDVFAEVNDPVERRANSFAAALLVPRSIVASLSRYDRATAVRAAYRYGVSCKTLGWRIKSVVGDSDLSRFLRTVDPFEAAVTAGEQARFEQDRDDRGRRRVSAELARALYEAVSAGAISERRLAKLIPSTVAPADGPDV